MFFVPVYSRIPKLDVARFDLRSTERLSTPANATDTDTSDALVHM